MKAKHDERMLAIWQSIQHWLETYESCIKPNGTLNDLKLGGRHCALCHYDSNRSNPEFEKTAPPDKPLHVTCMHCPIYHYYGTIECIKTPYSDIYIKMLDYDHSQDQNWSDDDRRMLAGLVALEYDFLLEVAFAEYEKILLRKRAKNYKRVLTQQLNGYITKQIEE